MTGLYFIGIGVFFGGLFIGIGLEIAGNAIASAINELEKQEE